MNSAAQVPMAQVTITPKGQVVRSVIWGQPVFFTVTNPRDAIQRKHRNGQFYEPEELEIIRTHFRPGQVFCDIGANIGNHTLFAMKFLHAARAVLFEPNPDAIAILRSNLQLNGIEDVCDLTHLGFGLSDATAEGLSIDVPAENLGGGRMVEGSGTLQTRRGDDVLAGTPVDFLKIDVEGMELRVLAGLEQTIAARQPSMFIEVDETNAAGFATWVQEHNYVVRAKHKRHRTNENFLIAPRPVRRRAVAT